MKGESVILVDSGRFGANPGGLILAKLFLVLPLLCFFPLSKYLCEFFEVRRGKGRGRGGGI